MTGHGSTGTLLCKSSEVLHVYCDQACIQCIVVEFFPCALAICERSDHLGVCPREHPTASPHHVRHRLSPETACLVLSTHAFIKQTCNTYKMGDPGEGRPSTLTRRTPSWPQHKHDRLWTAMVRGAPSGIDRCCRPISYTCCPKKTHTCCAIYKIDHIPQHLPKKHTTPNRPSKHSAALGKRLPK